MQLQQHRYTLRKREHVAALLSITCTCISRTNSDHPSYTAKPPSRQCRELLSIADTSWHGKL